MSWRLVLSEYPEPLFNDPKAMLSLAILENSGSQTEAELAAKLNMDVPEIAKLLLLLHRDRCVEYTRDNVLLTDRGKEFIDRLSLEPDILAQLLSKIDLLDDLREVLQAALVVYRKRSFSQYFASVTAMRTWEGLCRRSFLARDPNPEVQETGKLAILLRDLIRSRVFDHNVRAEMENAVEQGRKSVRFEICGLSHAGKTMMLSPVLRNAITWVDAYDSVADAEDPTERIRTLKSGAIQFFCALERSRDQEDLGFWRSRWTDPGSERLVVFNACRSASEFLDRASAIGDSPRQGTLGRVHERRLAASGVAPLLRQSVSEFLFHLGNATSLDDLTERTNTSGESLRPIIERLEARCHDLLEHAETAQKKSPAPERSDEPDASG